MTTTVPVSRRSLLRLAALSAASSGAGAIAACGAGSLQAPNSAEATITAQQTRIADLEKVAAVGTIAAQGTRIAGLSGATSGTALARPMTPTVAPPAPTAAPAGKGALPTLPTAAPAKPAAAPTAAPASAPLLGGAFQLIPLAISFDKAREGYKLLVFRFVLENKGSRPVPPALPERVYCTDGRGFNFELQVQPVGIVQGSVVIPPGYRILYQASGEVPANAADLKVIVERRDGAYRTVFSEATAASSPVSFPGELAQPMRLGQTFVDPGYLEVRPTSVLLLDPKARTLPNPFQVPNTPETFLYVFFDLKNLWGKDFDTYHFGIQLMDNKGNYYDSFAVAYFQLPDLIAKVRSKPVPPGLEKPNGVVFNLRKGQALGTELQLFVSASERKWAIYELSQADFDNGGKLLTDALDSVASYLVEVPKALKANNAAALAAVASGEDIQMLQKALSTKSTFPACQNIRTVEGASFFNELFLAPGRAQVGIDYWLVGGGSSTSVFELTNDGGKWRVQRGGANVLLSHECYRSVSGQ